MKLVLTTFDRKPAYVADTLRALYRHGNLLDLGASNSLTLLVTEPIPSRLFDEQAFLDTLPEEFTDGYGTDIQWLSETQINERDKMHPRQRTKLATRLALEMGADVVLQDDLDFACDWWPRFNALLPIDTSKLVVSLYFPQPARSVGLVQWYARDYYGHQAMFYGSETRGPAIDYLRDPRLEADDEALKRMLTKRQDLLLYACVPSLIQHTGVTSTLKSRMHRAPTFGLSTEECHAWLNKPRVPIHWPKKGGR